MSLADELRFSISPTLGSPEEQRAKVRELEDKVPVWVPVGERLPEDSATVWAYDRNHGLEQANFINSPDMKTKWWTRSDSWPLDDVSHWQRMPLPSPPEDK